MDLNSKIEKTQQQLNEVDKKYRRARNVFKKELYRVMCIRLDERIRVYEELMKGE